MKPTRSLKTRALQLLSQREQSRVELRRKLLAYLKADQAKARLASAEQSGPLDEQSGPSGKQSGPSGKQPGPSREQFGPSRELPDPSGEQPGRAEGPMDPVGQVDAVLDWLQAHQFASDERFAESRIHARSSRFGNLRIRQELKQHAVALTPEARQQLDESEEARAASVYRRRFGAPAETMAERGKRARFLTARGFSPEVVWRVLKQESSREQDSSASD